MGLGDLGALGDIGGIIGSMLAISVSAIVLLTFAPGIAGDIDGFSLSARAEGRCEFKGERFAWVLAQPTGVSDGQAAWAADAKTVYALSNDSGACKSTTTDKPAASDMVFTPRSAAAPPSRRSTAASGNSPTGR